MTQELPKCLAVRFFGKSLLQIDLENLRACGINDAVIIRGYLGDKFNDPALRYVWNHDYASNNVLGSLMTAASELEGHVLVCYSDVWYGPEVLERLLACNEDIALGVSAKVHDRTSGEAVFYGPGQKIKKIGVLGMPAAAQAEGEFMGVMKLGPKGCALLREHYERCRVLYDNKPFQYAKNFRRAYLTDLLQEMIDRDVSIRGVEVGPRWGEIDNEQDFYKVQAQYKETMESRGIHVQ
jgi:choline kinase